MTPTGKFYEARGMTWTAARWGLLMVALALVPTVARAQIRTTPPPEEYVLDELVVENDAVTLGRHVARLHHAARNCGGGFNEARVDVFGEASARLRDYRNYSDAYNAEARHLPGYQRFRGHDATCQRLYAFYGPRGSTARHAYSPLRNQFGSRSRPQTWLKRNRHAAG